VICNISEAEKALKPCKKCESSLDIMQEKGFYRAICSNTDCWRLSRKYKSLETLVERVNKNYSR
jgi:hypothetical protein